MIFLRNTLIVAAILYLVTLALLYIFQRKVLYFPPPIYLTPAAVELPQAVETPHGWWIAPRDDSVPVVMFFHGNASAVFSNHNIYRDLSARGYGVFAAGYPGYPGYDGAPSQNSITNAAIAGYDFVTAQGIAPDRIVFYGTSLGSGVAAQLSTRRPPALFIVEAPFYSAADMAQINFSAFPARLLTKDKFNSAAALSGRDIPLLWIHGTADNVVPMSEGQRLYDGYNGAKSTFIIDGAMHNNHWGQGGREAVFDAIDNIR